MYVVSSFKKGTAAKIARKTTGPFTNLIATVMGRRKASESQSMWPCQKWRQKTSSIWLCRERPKSQSSINGQKRDDRVRRLTCIIRDDGFSDTFVFFYLKFFSLSIAFNCHICKRQSSLDNILYLILNTVSGRDKLIGWSEKTHLTVDDKFGRCETRS